MARRTWLAILVTAAACGGADEGSLYGSPATTYSVDSPTGDTDARAASPRVCEPGRQVECPCPLGVQGAQACSNDGTTWEACQCPVVPEAGIDAGCVGMACCRLASDALDGMYFLIDVNSCTKYYGGSDHVPYVCDATTTPPKDGCLGGWAASLDTKVWCCPGI